MNFQFCFALLASNLKLQKNKGKKKDITRRVNICSEKVMQPTQIQGNSNCTKTEPFYHDLSCSGEQLALVLTPEPQHINGSFDGGTFC